MLLIEETKSYGSKTQLLSTAYSLLTASECPRIGLSPSLRLSDWCWPRNGNVLAGPVLPSQGEWPPTPADCQLAGAAD